MRKLTILTTAAAVAINAVSPAFATQLPSWSEVIKNVEAADKAGKFHGATRGKHSNVVFKPLSGADGFLFGNVLADDVPIPRVTDVRKVLQAAKQNEKPIIVASGEWILPSNPMLCEIAEQVKMTCGDFTRTFYAYMAKNDDGTYAGDEAANQTLSDIQADLVAKLEAMDLEIVTKNPVVEALKEQIASIKEHNPTGQDELIAELQKTLDIMDKFYGTEVDLTAINEVLQDVDTHYQTMKQNYIDEAEAHAQTIQNHIDLLASYRASMKSAGVPVNEDVQTMINSLVTMRDIALDKAAYWKESSETWEANSEKWEAQSNSWENAANEYQASAIKWQEAYDKELKAHEELKLAYASLQGQLASAQSALSNAQTQNANLANQLGAAQGANSDNEAEISALKSKIATLEATIETLKNADAEVIEKIVEVEIEKIVEIEVPVYINEGLNADQLEEILVGKEIDKTVFKYGCSGYCGNAHGHGWMLEGGGKVKIYLKDGSKVYIDLWGETGGKGVNEYLAGEYQKHLINQSGVVYNGDGTVTVSFKANEISTSATYNIDVPAGDLDGAIEILNGMIGTGLDELDGLPQVPSISTSVNTFQKEIDGIQNTMIGSFTVAGKTFQVNSSIGAKNNISIAAELADWEIEAIEAMLSAAYGKGYHDGYEDGYAQGWDDALNNAKVAID